jgi:hypothetical protein
MSQQTGTNSTHDVVNDINDSLCDNTTKIPFPTDYFGSRRTLQFLLCESCFWCASYIISDLEKRNITTCPYCNGVRLESIPILDDEICKFNYRPKRGVTLEFTRAC